MKEKPVSASASEGQPEVVTEYYHYRKVFIIHVGDKQHELEVVIVDGENFGVGGPVDRGTHKNPRLVLVDFDSRGFPRILALQLYVTFEYINAMFWKYDPASSPAITMAAMSLMALVVQDLLVGNQPKIHLPIQFIKLGSVAMNKPQNSESQIYPFPKGGIRGKG